MLVNLKVIGRKWGLVSGMDIDPFSINNVTIQPSCAAPDTVLLL